MSSLATIKQLIATLEEQLQQRPNDSSVKARLNQLYAERTDAEKAVIAATTPFWRAVSEMLEQKKLVKKMKIKRYEPEAEYVPPPPEDCEEEHDHETPERPEGYANPQNRGMFHNIKLEKLALRNPDAALNTAAHYDFESGFGDVRYVRKGSVVKLRLVRLLCDGLGLPHSCFAKTWTFAEWEAVAAKLVKEQVWSDDIVRADGSDFARTYKTSSLIKLLRGVFAVRTRRTGKEHPRRESLTVADDVSAVLTAWSLSEVKVTLEKGSPRKQSVKAAAEAAGTELDFNKFQAETKKLFIAENRAEFLNPKRKGMLNQAGVSEIKRLFDAKKAELNLPADFKAGVTLPQEFSVALIPYLNLYEPLPEAAGGGGGGGAAAPEQPKVGLLWHALPEQKPFKREDEENAKKKGLGRAALLVTDLEAGAVAYDADGNKMDSAKLIASTTDAESE
jgi:hypothetical protein